LGGLHYDQRPVYPLPNRQREYGRGHWSCESSCFHNNPQPDLNEGLGTLEIKPESLRFVVCATSDLLVDASFNVETWLLDKVSRGFRATIIAAILLSDGVR
jgi:hypothetical protein